MPDINGMMDNVFLRLGDPRANRPGYFQALNTVCTNIRTIKRHQRNTSNPWNYNDLIINVQPDLSTYLISATDFGTPLVVLTWNPSNPAWIARPIPFFQIQNIDTLNWGWPQNAAAAFIPYDGSNCTAQRCAFYWRDNQAYIDFLPMPMLSAEYKIRYLQSGNGVNTDALTTSPLSNEDADLCEVRSALGLLALTEWMAPDSKDGRAFNTERRKDLAATLQGEEAELRRQFEAAQLIFEGPRTFNRWNPARWSG